MIIRRLFFCLALFLFFLCFFRVEWRKKEEMEAPAEMMIRYRVHQRRNHFWFYAILPSCCCFGLLWLYLITYLIFMKLHCRDFFLSTKRSRTRNCPEISSKMSTICLSNPDDSIGNFGLWVASPIRIWTCSIDVGIILNEFEVTSLGSKYRWFVHRVRMI